MSTWLIAGEVNFGHVLKVVSERSLHYFSSWYFLRLLLFPFLYYILWSESLSPAHMVFNFCKMLLCSAPTPEYPEHSLLLAGLRESYFRHV